MAKGDIRLHKKYGLNVTIPVCFICGKDKNEVAMLGAAYKEEAPMRMMLDRSPCQECEGLMEQGIILISVRDGESSDNPYRTGGWVVVRDTVEWLSDEEKKMRVVFVPDKAWDGMKLPRGEEIDNREKMKIDNARKEGLSNVKCKKQHQGSNEGKTSKAGED